MYELQAHDTASTPGCCPAQPREQTSLAGDGSALATQESLSPCGSALFYETCCHLCSPSTSSLHFLLQSTRENVFAFCIPYKTFDVCFLVLPEMEDSTFFSFCPHFWIIHMQEGENAVVKLCSHQKSTSVIVNIFFYFKNKAHIHYRKFRC